MSKSAAASWTCSATKPLEPLCLCPSPPDRAEAGRLLGCLTLGACGQRGDLYLPSSSATPERATLGDALVAPLTTATPVSSSRACSDSPYSRPRLVKP